MDCVLIKNRTDIYVFISKGIHKTLCKSVEVAFYWVHDHCFDFKVTSETHEGK